MDRIGKNLGVIVLGVIFLIAALIYGRNCLTDRDREEEQEENGTSFPFEKIYTAGEEVASINVVCQMNQAEFFTDYEELDSFYKEREYLVKPAQYLMQSSDSEGVFPEDIQFIHLNFSVTNHSKMVKTFVPGRLQLTSISDDYESRNWGDFIACDGEYRIEKEGNETKKIELSGKSPDSSVLEAVSILPEETAVIDFVGEFFLFPGYDVLEAYGYSGILSADEFFKSGDLYLSISGLGTEVTTGQGLRGEKIRLDIDCGQSAGTRVIQTVKSNNWTNLERSRQQTESYLFASVQETLGYPYTRLFDVSVRLSDNMTNCYKKTAWLLDYWTADWKDLPQEYIEQGHLQRMAQRYKDIYGYEAEELKVLFLDVGYSAEMIGTATSQYLHSFYGNSLLYMRKNEKEWYLFGTADEWRITENSGFPEHTGFIDSSQLKVGESLRAELAYILPPDVYRQQKDLYFFGGYPQSRWDIPENTPVTRISL